MNINSLFVPLMILAFCIIILSILIVILYCTCLKYIRKHSRFSRKIIEKQQNLFAVNTTTANMTVSESNSSTVDMTASESDSSTIDMTISESDSSTVDMIASETDTLDSYNTTSQEITDIDAPSTNLMGFLSNLQPTVEVDIIQAAKDAIESLTPFAEAQKIKLHLSTTCEELMIMAVPESIRILFRNIIDNSIKYMGRAGHMIITISLLGDDIFIILKDTGKGLNEEETTHIFELNFQGSNRVSGNGLGLTQSKIIVEAFGGTIYAKSSPENGMAIYIQLPVSKKDC